MRARVLITDGTDIIDLFWVCHNGSDVYCGLTNVDDKRSYHASGKVHSIFAGERRDEGWYVPLKDLKGQFQLTGITIGDMSRFIKSNIGTFGYSGRKSDAVLLVDTRSVPTRMQTHISVGLVEPGNGSILAWLMNLPFKPFGEDLKPQQALFATSV